MTIQTLRQGVRQKGKPRRAWPGLRGFRIIGRHQIGLAPVRESHQERGTNFEGQAERLTTYVYAAEEGLGSVKSLHVLRTMIGILEVQGLATRLRRSVSEAVALRSGDVKGDWLIANRL